MTMLFAHRANVPSSVEVSMRRALALATTLG